MRQLSIVQLTDLLQLSDLSFRLFRAVQGPFRCWSPVISSIKFDTFAQVRVEPMPAMSTLASVLVHLL